MSTPEIPRRKFPPPCWTHDETVALIEAYREKWYALRRGYLRTPDWDAVAVEVNGRCPDVTPAKSSAQCRHKMEKLRQKYRNEKQRSLSCSGRFFSSWIFFDHMDCMEIGPSPRTDHGSADQVKALEIDQVGFGFKPLKLKKVDPDLKPNGLDLGRDCVTLSDRSGRIGVNLGFRAKNDGNCNPNFGSRVMNGYPYQLEDGSDQDEDSEVGFGGDFKNPKNGDFPPGFRGHPFGKSHGNLKSSFTDQEADNGVDGFRVETNIHQNSGSRVKKIGKFENGDNHSVYNNGKIANGGFSVKSPSDWNSAPNFDPRVLNGIPTSKSGPGKKNGGGRGAKREGGLVEEMVSSIKLLAEGFVKTEKLKMEMTREIEQMRMEMEMKRSKLILESQQQMVDAFVKVLMENKKQKTSAVATPET